MKKKKAMRLDIASVLVGVGIGVAAKAAWTAFSALSAEQQVEVLKTAVDAIAAMHGDKPSPKPGFGDASALPETGATP